MNGLLVILRSHRQDHCVEIVQCSQYLIFADVSAVIFKLAVRFSNGNQSFIRYRDGIIPLRQLIVNILQNLRKTGFFFGKGKFIYRFRFSFLGILRVGLGFSFLRIRIRILQDDLIFVPIHIRDRHDDGVEIGQSMGIQIFINGDSFFIVYSGGINGLSCNVIDTENIRYKLSVFNTGKGIGILRRIGLRRFILPGVFSYNFFTFRSCFLSLFINRLFFRLFCFFFNSRLLYSLLSFFYSFRSRFFNLLNFLFNFRGFFFRLHCFFNRLFFGLLGIFSILDRRFFGLLGIFDLSGFFCNLLNVFFNFSRRFFRLLSLFYNFSISFFRLLGRFFTFGGSIFGLLGRFFVFSGSIFGLLRSFFIFSGSIFGLLRRFFIFRLFSHFFNFSSNFFRQLGCFFNFNGSIFRLLGFVVDYSRNFFRFLGFVSSGLSLLGFVSNGFFNGLLYFRFSRSNIGQTDFSITNMQSGRIKVILNVQNKPGNNITDINQASGRYINVLILLNLRNTIALVSQTAEDFGQRNVHSNAIQSIGRNSGRAIQRDREFLFHILYSFSPVCGRLIRISLSAFFTCSRIIALFRSIRIRFAFAIFSFLIGRLVSTLLTFFGSRFSSGFVLFGFFGGLVNTLLAFVGGRFHPGFVLFGLFGGLDSCLLVFFGSRFSYSFVLYGLFGRLVNDLLVFFGGRFIFSFWLFSYFFRRFHCILLNLFGGRRFSAFIGSCIVRRFNSVLLYIFHNRFFFIFSFGRSLRCLLFLNGSRCIFFRLLRRSFDGRIRLRYAFRFGDCFLYFLLTKGVFLNLFFRRNFFSNLGLSGLLCRRFGGLLDGRFIIHSAPRSELNGFLLGSPLGFYGRAGVIRSHVRTGKHPSNKFSPVHRAHANAAGLLIFRREGKQISTCLGFKRKNQRSVIVRRITFEIAALSLLDIRVKSHACGHDVDRAGRADIQTDQSRRIIFRDRNIDRSADLKFRLDYIVCRLQFRNSFRRFRPRR